MTRNAASIAIDTYIAVFLAALTIWCAWEKLHELLRRRRGRRELAYDEAEVVAEAERILAEAEL